jgi:hypothetical protein
MLFKYNCRASRLHASFAMCILHSMTFTAVPSRLKNRVSRRRQENLPLASHPSHLCTPGHCATWNGNPLDKKTYRL